MTAESLADQLAAQQQLDAVNICRSALFDVIDLIGLKDGAMAEMGSGDSDRWRANGMGGGVRDAGGAARLS